MAADVRKILHLSAGHVTKEVRDWLNAQGEMAGKYHRTWREANASPDLHMAPHVYGWLLWVYTDPPAEWTTEHTPPFVAEVPRPDLRVRPQAWLRMDQLRHGRGHRGEPSFLRMVTPRPA